MHFDHGAEFVGKGARGGVDAIAERRDIRYVDSVGWLDNLGFAVRNPIEHEVDGCKFGERFVDIRFLRKQVDVSGGSCIRSTCKHALASLQHKSESCLLNMRHRNRWK